MQQEAARRARQAQLEQELQAQEQAEAQVARSKLEAER